MMFNSSLSNDIEKIFYSEKEIQSVVTQIGRQISVDYRNKDLLLVSILKGSVLFMTDLMRQIDLPCAIDFMAVSSYVSGTKTSGVVQILKDLSSPIEGKDVLIVEDILDSGLTLDYVMNLLRTRNPKSLRICTLFDKPSRRQAQIKADYVGFEVPDEFIVGYGLDYNEKYRNLPYIGVLKPSVYRK